MTLRRRGFTALPHTSSTRLALGRIHSYEDSDADLELLGARLGSRLPEVLAEGAAMTREQVSELLATLERTVPVPQS